MPAGARRHTPGLRAASPWAWPAMSVSYKIGMIKIMELRQAAMDELGDRFDLKAFHRVVLENGNVPLDVLERLQSEHTT